MSLFHTNTMALSQPTQTGALQSLQPPDVSISENPCPSGAFAWLPAPLQLSGVHALPFLAAVWAPQRGVQSPAVSDSSLHPNQCTVSPVLVHRLSGPGIVCWRTVPKSYPCLSSWLHQIATYMGRLHVSSIKKAHAIITNKRRSSWVTGDYQTCSMHLSHQVAGKMAEWKGVWENKGNGQMKDWDMCNYKNCKVFNMFHEQMMQTRQSSVRRKINEKTSH